MATQEFLLSVPIAQMDGATTGDLEVAESRDVNVFIREIQRRMAN